MALSDEEFNRDLQEILGDDASSDSSTGLHFGTSKKAKAETGKRKNKKANVSLPSWYSGDGPSQKSDDQSDDNNDDDWFTSEPTTAKQTVSAQPSIPPADDSNVDVHDDDLLTQHSATDIKDSKHQLTTTDSDRIASTDRNIVDPTNTIGDQDTSTETQEKNKFLNQFEKNYGSDVPYGKLCDELENSNNLSISTNNQTKDDKDWTLHDQIQDSNNSAGLAQPRQPDLALDGNRNQFIKPSMLSKVSLADTLDSTLHQTIKEDDDDVVVDTLKLGTIGSAINTKSGAIHDLDAIKKVIEKAGLSGNDDEDVANAEYASFDKDFVPLASKSTTPNVGILESRADPVIDRTSNSDTTTASDDKLDQQRYHLQDSKINESAEDSFKNDQRAPGVQSQGVQDDYRKQEKAMDDYITEPRGFDLQPNDIESEDEQKSSDFHDKTDDEPRGFDLQAIDTDSDSTISVTKSASMEKKLRAAKEKLKASNEKSKPKSSYYASPSTNVPTLAGKNFIERNKINAKKRDPRTTQANTPRKELRSTPVKKTPNR